MNGKAPRFTLQFVESLRLYMQKSPFGERLGWCCMLRVIAVAVRSSSVFFFASSSRRLSDSRRVGDYLKVVCNSLNCNLQLLALKGGWWPTDA